MKNSGSTLTKSNPSR